LDGAAHGQTRGVQDVQFLDLFHRGEADAPGDGASLDFGLQRRAARLRQGRGGVGDPRPGGGEPGERHGGIL
ncbi:MAG: hypothetical protein ACK4F7_07330, partial [Inhella sp.]